MNNAKPPTVAEEYESLFHYTNYQGLEGIIESQTLWATHYRYLNDAEELIHAKTILHRIVSPKVKEFIEKGILSSGDHAKFVEFSGGVEKVAQDESQKLIDRFYSALLLDSQGYDSGLPGPFILAFCAAKDSFVKRNGLLSQWRGYGVDGGYLIEFDSKQIENLIKNEIQSFYYPVGVFADVGYGEKLDDTPIDFKADVLELEEKIFRFINFFDQVGEQEDFPNEILMLFVKLISRSKHVGFKEENEIRAVFFPGSNQHRVNETKPEIKQRQIKLLKFKSFGGTPRPYIELFELNKKLPIKRIIVGPHRDKELRKKSLGLKLKNLGIEVRSSSIPYLG